MLVGEENHETRPVTRILTISRVAANSRLNRSRKGGLL